MIRNPQQFERASAQGDDCSRRWPRPIAQDTLLQAALEAIGYRIEVLPCPDTAALHYGKEFGNRGQCNPTYFTVGNLIKRLIHLRDVARIPVPEIAQRYVFLTAGACGPCRFGTYATEYRKALRDAGFDGFRVLLFQQQGGFKQATGPRSGIGNEPALFCAGGEIPRRGRCAKCNRLSHSTLRSLRGRHRQRDRAFERNLMRGFS